MIICRYNFSMAQWLFSHGTIVLKCDWTTCTTWTPSPQLKPSLFAYALLPTVHVLFHCVCFTSCLFHRFFNKVHGNLVECQSFAVIPSDTMWLSFIVCGFSNAFQVQRHQRHVLSWSASLELPVWNRVATPTVNAPPLTVMRRTQARWVTEHCSTIGWHTHFFRLISSSWQMRTVLFPGERMICGHSKTT